MRRPVNATVSSIEGKSFVDGQVSWNSIGFSTAGVYRVKFRASSSLPESTFNLSSDMGMVEVLPCGLPATLHILQQPSNAAPVKTPVHAVRLIRNMAILRYPNDNS